MKDVIEHDGFLGSVHFSPEDKCFFGKIEGIDDLVSFEGNTVERLTRNFNNAVRDYQKLCQKQGKAIFKSCKGSFNVRVPRELHTAATRKAVKEGLTLNQLVKRAIEAECQS